MCREQNSPIDAAEQPEGSSPRAADMRQHSTAQQHFIQALRLARSAGDVQTGSCVLATMSLHACLHGHLTEAIDTAEGACGQAESFS